MQFEEQEQTTQPVNDPQTDSNESFRRASGVSLCIPH